MKFRLTTLQSQQLTELNQIVPRCRGKEEAQDAYSSENEARGMDVHLGIEGTNSNGHGEEIDKEVGMMKIIKRLKKDVQIHQADNERLKKAQEKQEDFNMKLMQEPGNNRK